MSDESKPALDKAAKKVVHQYDSTLCPYCLASSRISTSKGAKYRKCQKGHRFVRKSDA